MANWFTSDTHFSHKHVIEYCHRPFASVEEMNAEMIRRWQAVVKPTDTIFHLGDFAFCGAVAMTEILKQLPGHKVLVLGNHDHHKQEKFVRLGFQQAVHHYHMRLGDYHVHMSHFPYKGTEADERKFDRQLEDGGDWLLHGHVHEHWKVKNKMINVGVDRWDFTPVHEDKILEIIRVG